jgi:hypothetical protein
MKQDPGRGGPYPGIRRAPGVILLRCAYDIRPIFEENSAALPLKRDTPLAIVMPLRADHPRIFELLPVVFDLLAVLDDWTDPSAFGDTPEDLIVELKASMLVEVRR